MSFTLANLLTGATGQATSTPNAVPTLTLPSPLPPALAKALPQSLTLTVLNATSTSGNTTLQLPDGTTLTTKLSPPLQPGTQLQLTLTAAQLAGANRGTSTLTVPLRLLTTPPAATPTQPQQLPTLSLSGTSLATAANASSNTSTQPELPSLLPPGPVLLTATPPANISAQTAASLPAPNLPVGQPITLTVLPPLATTPPDATRLALPTTPGQPPQTLTLTTGTQLPTGSTVTLLPLAPTQPTQLATPLPAGVPAAAAAQAQGTQAGQPAAQPALLLSATAPETSPPIATQISPATLQPTPTLAIPATAVVRAPVTIAAPASPVTLPARVLAPTPTPNPATTANNTPTPTTTSQQLLLPDGTQLTLESPTPLPAGSVVQISLAPNQEPTLVTPTTTPTTTTTPAPNTPTIQLSAGTQLTGVITSPASPTGTGTQQQLTLTITTPGPFQGQTVPLDIPDSPTAATLPIGTQLTLQTTASGHAEVLTLTPPTGWQATQAVVNLSQQWPALQQVTQQAQTLAPSLAQSLAQKVPLLAAFLPGFTAYASAIQQNAPEKAFGADTLAFAKALGLPLGSDVQQLHTLQQPPAQSGQPTDTWRGLLFPYQEQPGSQPQQGKFFWRQQKSAKQNDDDPTSTNTRFVVELNLTQLGPIQLDGLVNYPSIYMRLRLTQPTGDATFTQSLQQVVQSTLNKSGLEGGLAVENVATFPIDPSAELLASTNATQTTLA